VGGGDRDRSALYHWKVTDRLYLGKAAVGSAYGAAGSLIVVIVWVYYSAMIFFFGAEFAHVRATGRQSANAGKARSVH
jgi:membrane protein